MFRTKISEALAHLKQLTDLGCDYEEAVGETAVAFELDPESVEMLESCFEYELLTEAEGEMI